jgi:uncharacterized transporter YbjL
MKLLLLNILSSVYNKLLEVKISLAHVIKFLIAFFALLFFRTVYKDNQQRKNFSNHSDMKDKEIEATKNFSDNVVSEIENIHNKSLQDLNQLHKDYVEKERQIKDDGNKEIARLKTSPDELIARIKKHLNE